MKTPVDFSFECSQANLVCALVHSSLSLSATCP